MIDEIKYILKLAIPAVLEMLLYMLVWVVDTAFLGKYGGNTTVSAAGFSSEISYTAVNVIIAQGISVGITTLVAQNIGAKKKNHAERFLSQGFLIGTILSFIIACSLGIFPSFILKFAGAKTSVIIHGSRFLRIISIGLFFNMLTGLMNAGLRGSGNTVTPLIVSGIINSTTIILDYILIFGRLGFQPLGITGSAIANTIAFFTGFIILVYYYRNHSLLHFNTKYLKMIKLGILKKIVRLAIPSSMQEAAFSFSRLITLSFIMHIGTIAFASNQITTTIESISFMPGWGFGIAATTLCGQSIGAKDSRKAKHYALVCTILGTIVMSLGSIMFLLFPRQLLHLFINDVKTIDLGSKCLMAAALEQPTMAIAMILEGAMKGLGNTKTPFKISLVSGWCIRIPLIFVSIFILHISVVYVWFITAIQWAFECICAAIFFKKSISKCKFI